MKSKKITYYDINKNQYFGDVPFFVFNGIPSNVIIEKLLAGCGATTFELKYYRNSIIIVPNIPVIEGKCEKFNTKDKTLVLGIYEKTTDEDIYNYLASDVEYKKIMVTPESFYRIKEAIGEEMYKNYFLLFDECERTIQDVAYRGYIILPMDDFFRFEKKAFISATPIIPSDRRFKDYGFKRIALNATYDYREEISVLTTNNIISTLRKFLQNNPRDKYFIFFNSVDGIAEIISKLRVGDNSAIFCTQGETAIFCAKDSRKKLMVNGFSNVSTKLKDFKKFNFFTSRFYSAVDIDYEMYQTDPTIIMITDLVFAAHSMIDPLSEAVQITGRFRKPIEEHIPFKKEVVHISNVNPGLSSMTEEEVWKHLNEQHAVYRFVKRYHEGATTIGAKSITKEMLKNTEYSKFINQSTGARNYYMIDNLIHEERVAGYYRNRENLLSSYQQGKHFVLSEKCSDEVYEYTDYHRRKGKDFQSLKSLSQFIAERLKSFVAAYRNDAMALSFEMANLSIDFPKEMGYINLIGIQESEKLGFNIEAIKRHLESEKKKKDDFGLKKHIETSFKCGSCYTSTKIKTILKAGFKKCELKGMKASVKLLRRFCKLSKERTYMYTDAKGKRIEGYVIQSHL